jgi:hypothetical protein
MPMEQVLSLYKTVYVSIFLLKSTLLCCFLIPIIFVPLNRVSVKMRRKYEKVSYNVHIEGFLILHSNWGQKFRFLTMLNFIHNRVLATRLIWKTITPKPLIVSGHANNCWKDEKVFYNSSIYLLVWFRPYYHQNYIFWKLSQTRQNWRRFCSIMSWCHYCFINYDLLLDLYSFLRTIYILNWW